MFKVALGHSEDIDSLDGINQVIDQCNKILSGDKPSSGILLVGIDHDFELILKRINEEYPGIELVGSTTEGELSSLKTFVEDSISLMLFCSDEVIIKAGAGKNVSKDPEFATKQAVEEAKSKMDVDPELCITTPDGLKISQVRILEGLKSVLGKKFPIVGGSAGGDYEQKKTFQFYKESVLTDSIPILLFGGPLQFSVGVSSGWTPIGKKQKVTRAEGNVVYELDGISMLEFYKHYLGDLDFTIGDHPLAVFEEDKDHFYLRVAFYLDEENNSITFAGDIPEGAYVQIAETSSDKIIEAASDSVKQALNGYNGDDPQALLVFSCAVRKFLLGTRTCKEYDAVAELFSRDFPFCGFYAYGELGPFMMDSPACMHNVTFITLLLGVK